MYSHMYSPLSYNAFPWSHDEQYNLKIIQKLGLKPSIKKRSGHRRGVRQGFVGSEGDCSSRIFHLTPRGKVPFKDFVFPHVDKYFFLLAIFPSSYFQFIKLWDCFSLWQISSDLTLGLDYISSGSSQYYRGVS
jgi:hypothetical protein